MSNCHLCCDTLWVASRLFGQKNSLLEAHFIAENEHDPNVPGSGLKFAYVAGPEL